MFLTLNIICLTTVVNGTISPTVKAFPNEVLSLVATHTGDPATPFQAQRETMQGPLENKTLYRGDIVLNGIWQFVPAKPGSGKPSENRGLIWVPGNWKKDSGDAPTVIKEATGEEWKIDRNELAKAWYVRKITVPMDWSKQSVFLDLRRVSTDAEVFLDGVSAGKISWPTGPVDLTKLIKPGKEQELSILVLSAAEANEVPVLMGVGQVSMAKSTLQWKGIMDDVVLSCRPIGGRIEDVFVKPSTRKSRVDIDLELTDIREPEEVQVEVEMLDESGRVEQKFNTSIKLSTSKMQKHKLGWDWKNPRLWDLNKPNIYTARVRITGDNFKDEYLQEFGFREFWIDGRDFFLNGSKFRFRPTLGYSGGNRQRSALEIAELKKRGFNIQEIWPNNDEVRGYVQLWEHHVAISNKMGWPLMGPSTHMDPVVSWWSPEKWSDPQARATWLAAFERSIKRYRNSPSILLWANSGNNFGNNHDQAPDRIGQSRSNPIWSKENDRWNNHHKNGDLVYAAMKSFDPTRPFMAHQGGPISDVYTANTYLNLLPLQDREEWLSEWAKTGDMPYSAVEFGTPLNCTVLRGRNGFGPAIASEVLATEYSAMLFGEKAYEIEEDRYRKAIKENFIKDQEYRWWMFEPTHQFGPPFQAILDLYVKNTWRSWRTWGISGGMIPWAEAHGWERNHSGKQVTLNTFKPGFRGLVAFDIPSRDDKSQEIVHLSGRTLMENNQETLAWIGGRADHWTEKSHHFWTESTVEKSIILINDSRTNQPYSARLQVDGGIAKTFTGLLTPGETKIVPITFTTSNRNGRFLIKLEAEVGKLTHKDTLAFEVFKKLSPKSEATIAIIDRGGQTTKWLKSLGYKVEKFNHTRSKPLTFLVIGKRSMGQGKPLSRDIESFILKGGRVLVMGQDPKWLQETLGFRTAAYASRRAFPVSTVESLSKMFNGEQLSDWAGKATLLPEKPDYVLALKPSSDSSPYYGWTWGMQGVVSSAMLEKPHRSGWTPLLEGEFDLAYSPLMELTYGKGKITFCQLDLEDQSPVDPVARLLSSKILDHTQSSKIVTRLSKIPFLGKDTSLLDSAGVEYTLATQLTRKDPVAIVGSDANITVAQVKTFLESGGKLVFLPRQKGFGPMNLKKVSDSVGSLSAPVWPETYGMSASDLRRRSVSESWLVEPTEDKSLKIGAAGQLARWTYGKGVAIFFQMDPALLNADTQTYLRFTRWRQTRALSQVLSNVGATFKIDRRIFNASNNQKSMVEITGNWFVKLTNADPILPDTPSNDPGTSKTAMDAILNELDPTKWETQACPGSWSKVEDQLKEAVLRREVEIPENWKGKDLILNLGMADDYDTTYFNGVEVGSTDKRTPDWWSVRRSYTIPGNLVRPGKNTIAVRFLNIRGGGGLHGPARVMGLMLKGLAPPPSFYHPDYRIDFELGDDPYRYYRW